VYKTREHIHCKDNMAPSIIKLLFGLRALLGFIAYISQLIKRDLRSTGTCMWFYNSPVARAAYTGCPRVRSLHTIRVAFSAQGEPYAANRECESVQSTRHTQHSSAQGEPYAANRESERVCSVDTTHAAF
jgi:hypothetical protein